MKDMQPSPAEKIDELDLMLVRELEVNARQSNAELGAKLGISPPSVRRRMQRLIDAEMISIVAIPDWLALGFPLMAVIGINTRPGKANNVADYLRELPSARAVIATTGRYQVFLPATFCNLQELLLFMTQEMGSNPDVDGFETMIVLKMVKDSWRYLKGEETGPREANLRKLDPHERRLIREITLQPRASIIDLSKKLGLSRLSVGRKLQALFDDNILHVVSVANPLALGFDVQVAILVKVQPGAIIALSDRLLPDKRVNHLAITAGSFQLLILAIFPNANDLSYFIRNDLRGSAGVLDTETVFYMPGAKCPFGLIR
ncbi:MAG: Lrp/AsnC family transcriptional regulator [Dehalococcoidia bacterium]|nr:Lrp/AsnC family transcriptional regulator [Dehalococcoidia bacterium]